MKKSFRILALVMALMTALGAASFASAEVVKDYVGTTTMVESDFFYQGPGTSYAFVQGQSRVEKGTRVILFGITSDGKWSYIGFDIHMGYVQTSCLDDAITLKNGNTDSIKAMLARGSSASSGNVTVGPNGSTTATTNATGVIYNCTNWVSLRAEASSSSKRVAKLTPNTTVTILEQTNGWYKVTYKSYTGYLSADYVRVVGGGASAPGSAGSTGGVNTPGSTGNNVGSVSSNGTQYAKYTGTSADIWGSMSVAGTNISDNIYCNAMNSKGQFVYNAYSSSKNNLYALSYLTDPIAVIYGHNMRKVAKKQTTNLGLHELHHVQNAWLGKAKCEYCGRSCSGAKTSTFNINYNGSSSWTLVGFFELSNSTMSSAAQRKKIQTYASFNSTLTGSAKQQWVDTMMSYCNSKYLGATLGSISGSDKVMVIITCADKSGSKNQSMYMILKGN